MQVTELSLTARALYAELSELALAIGATETIGPTPGTVSRKTIKGKSYLYYQYRDLDGRTRQAYLGADDDKTGALVDALVQRASDRESDQARLNQLRAAFLGAGGAFMDHRPLRVLKAFADAGVLRPGQGCAVLIGTHAFNAYANLLGVRWSSLMPTQDIDLAGWADLDLAIARPSIPVPEILDQLEMGFVPVPTLDPRKPSTSFRVRGQEMRVDLLTPQVGKPKSEPIHVPALNAVAQPLRYLDYLLEDAVPVVICGRNTQVLVNVPAPERFALHKMLVSESRDSAFATKAAKDRLQAALLLEVLQQEAPDGVAMAKAELVSRGKGWSDRLGRALAKVSRDHPDVVTWVDQQ